MDNEHPVYGIGIFLLFIIIHAVLYGFGAAIQSVNENTIEERARNGDKKSERIRKFIEKPQILVNSIHMSAIIMDFAAGAYLIELISAKLVKASDFEPSFLIPLGITVIGIIFLSVFGIFVPKKIASRNSEKWVYFLFSSVYMILFFVRPIAFLVTKNSNFVLRLFGIDPNAYDGNVTEEEIITIVNEGHEQGLLLASEAEMITNIVEFGDKEAQDIMTNRKNIVAIDGNSTINQVFNKIVNQNLSRFPVYEKDIDNIIGILHFKDLMKIYADGYKRNYTIIELQEEMLFDANFIPETRSIDALFKSMQSQKIHMVIVVDEYGQTSGIVTMEDILEEIVGNIMDEYDEEKELICYEEDDCYVMEGTTFLEDITELIDIEFDEEDFDTLNGFMIFKLGKIPEEGEVFSVEYKGYQFEILEAENKVIKKVRVKKIK